MRSTITQLKALMKKFIRHGKKTSKRPVLLGAVTAFSIMGGDLEVRRSGNIEASWNNVGVFFKRAMNNTSEQKGLKKRFLEEEELETF
jgi:hypothetical protein